MFKDRNVTFVRADDWEGMYINGKLVIEDNSIPFEWVLDQLGINYTFKYIDRKQFLEHGSRMPEELKDVKEYDS